MLNPNDNVDRVATEQELRRAADREEEAAELELLVALTIAMRGARPGAFPAPIKFPPMGGAS